MKKEQPVILKTPDMPVLSKEDILALTDNVFTPDIHPQKCDLLFVFSGTHPGHWETALEIFNKNLCDKILVTGEKSLTGTDHPEWDNRYHTESEKIRDYLIEHGVDENIIIMENKSTNSLENVLCAKEIFDFSTINTVIFTCKAHAANRQLRTLLKNLPSHIKYVPYPFNTTYNNEYLTKQNWMNQEDTQKRIWGEYLRIDYYGAKGDIFTGDISESIYFK